MLVVQNMLDLLLLRYVLILKLIFQLHNNLVYDWNLILAYYYPWHLSILNLVEPFMLFDLLHSDSSHWISV